MLGVICRDPNDARATVEGAVRAPHDRMHCAEGARSSFAMLLDGRPGTREGLHRSPGDGFRASLRGTIGRKSEPVGGDQGAALLAQLWRSLGADLICDVTGLFSGAVWSPDDDRLTLLSDWAGGLHQLYYATEHERFMFATDLRLMLAALGSGPEIDAEALAQYLDFGHVLPPLSFCEGISKLPPGSVLSYHSGAADVRRVFRLGSAAGAEPNYPVERFTDAHREAVRRCLDCSPDAGAFLSGGIDSSFNVAAMSRISARKVRTFSVIYPGSALDESSEARLVAEHFGTEHHELALRDADVLDELPQIVWALQEPAMDCSAIPTFNLARFARRHVTAVIGGDGPDHLLGRHYPVALLRRTLGRLPGVRGVSAAMLPAPRSAGWRRRGWRRLRRTGPGRLLWKALLSLSSSPLDAYLGIYREIACRGLLPERAEWLLSEEVDLPAQAPPHPSGLDNLQGRAGEFEGMTALDLAIDGACGVFAKVGRMAAHHDLLVHEPYLDADLRAFVEAVPAGMKADGSVLDLCRDRLRKKVLLYRAAEGVLPDDILHKPKQGFQAPIGEWLREWLDGHGARELLPALTEEVGLLDAGRVTDLLREHVAGGANHETLIMMLITLDLWHAIFVSGGACRPDWRWSDRLGDPVRRISTPLTEAPSARPVASTAGGRPRR